MPFAFAYGFPEGTSFVKLRGLRRSLVATIEEEMDCPGWVRIFFPVDILDEPESKEDGATTIYIRLETAMLGKLKQEEADAAALRITGAIANLVHKAFDGKYEVEVFIGELNFKWKTVLQANP